MKQILLVLIKIVPISFAALMPVINPIGTSIILLGMTEGASDATRKQLARAIGINTIVLLTAVLIGGSYVLAFFGITVPIVQASGGLVLAAMGWRMLNQTDGAAGEPTAGRDASSSQVYADKTFYPFTFPLTVGPGGVAVTLTLSAHTTHGTFADTIVGQAGAFIGIVAVGYVMYFCFAYSSAVAKRLGPAGLSVLMRLLAFVVLCLGASICWSGISRLISELPSRAP